MPSDKKTKSARQRILEVADELFYREGIRAVGVDTIIAKSGVAKTTLYRYFPSKDDLVVAYLEERNRRFWELFEEAIAQYPNKPKEQLLAVFGWLDQLLAKPECYGCPFLVTTTEFPELGYPGHQVAVAHKLATRDRLIALAEQAGAANPHQLGAHLLLLFDGAFAERRLFGQSGSGVHLKAIVATLINSNLPENLSQN
jgi:AcrR family transcriptional regulator